MLSKVKVPSRSSIIKDSAKIIETIPEILEKQKQMTVEQINDALEIIKDKIAEIETKETTQKGKSKKGGREKRRKFNSDDSEPNSGSSSDSDEPHTEKYEEEKKPKSYRLVRPCNLRNRVTEKELKDALNSSDDGVQLEMCLNYLGLAFTNFQVARGNVNENIFGRLALIGCIPQPRGLVCPRCGFNIYDMEDNMLDGLMRKHYINTHSHWCKDNGMEQFFKVYGPNCGGKFEAENGTTEFDYFRTGIGGAQRPSLPVLGTSCLLMDRG
jgi:hypothetical protein